MNRFLESNRALWNKYVAVHAESEFYDVVSFKAGKCSLHDIERREIGDVDGKSLLHLQCHFGMDTISFARLGAVVTGVDFASAATQMASSIASELRIPAEFICCDIYDLPQQLDKQFDVVYTGGGVLTWLPDIRRWAQIAARYTRPGGLFYLREFHPFGGIFDDETAPGVEPRIRYPYFHSKKPLRFEDDGSYADRSADVSGVSYEWLHSMSDIVNALIAAGFRIDCLNEFPYSSYQALPCLAEGEDGNWRYEPSPESIPLMFSIKATRE